jgi:CBS domain containing-hemolysin-like protein
LNTQVLEHIFLLVVLLSLSFFFSGSETALFSLPRVVIERLRQTSASGRQAAHLLDQPNRLLVTILIGNLAVNILISAIIGVWALRLVQHPFVASVVAVVVTTLLLLFFGEIAPKTLAINNAQRFALAVAFPLRLFARMVYPILRVILLLTDSALKLVGVGQGESHVAITEEEIKTLLAMGEEEGVIKSSERLMIHRIFEFGDTLVRDVYVPRADMVRVRFDTTIEELTNIMRETGHSRFPVYGKTVDDIRGVVYAKDFTRYFRRGLNTMPISLFVRPAYYVPETKKVRDLLREFQSGRLHMAIVVDEHGGTAGLVTLEDLIEEVVGEIFDEYDVRTKELERLPDGSLRVDARMRLDNLSAILGRRVDSRECDTVGGLVYDLLEHVPAPNESVEYEGFRFTVEDIKNRRIRTVRVSSISEQGTDREPPS